MKNIETQGVAWSRSVGEAVRGIRDASGWTQQQVADRLTSLGYPTKRATVAKTENATRPITLEDVAAYATALDVDRNALLTPQSVKARIFFRLATLASNLAEQSRTIDSLEEQLDELRAKRSAVQEIFDHLLAQLPDDERARFTAGYGER